MEDPSSAITGDHSHCEIRKLSVEQEASVSRRKWSRPKFGSLQQLLSPEWQPSQRRFDVMSCRSRDASRSQQRMRSSGDLSRCRSQSYVLSIASSDVTECRHDIFPATVDDTDGADTSGRRMSRSKSCHDMDGSLVSLDLRGNQQGAPQKPSRRKSIMNLFRKDGVNNGSTAELYHGVTSSCTTLNTIDTVNSNRNNRNKTATEENHLKVPRIYASFRRASPKMRRQTVNVAPLTPLELREACDSMSEGIERDDYKLLKTILKQRTIDLNTLLFTNLQSPLIHQACYKGRLKIIRLFIKHDARLDLADAYGLRPLHAAVLGRDAEVAKLLLEQKQVCVDEQDQYGHSALHYSVIIGHHALAALLMCFGADPLLNFDKGHTTTPFHYAIMMRKRRILDFMITMPQFLVSRCI